MIITTTNSIESARIESYIGVISGEAILGANIIRDMFAGFRDIIGGRSGSYEKKLRQGKEVALEEMKQEASKLGANAIVGVDLDYASLGAKGSMLMVTASGTAVRISN